jgi:hypothetical protein
MADLQDKVQVQAVEQVQDMADLLEKALVEEQAYKLVLVRLQVELYVESAYQQVVYNFEYKAVVQQQDKGKAVEQVHRMDTSLAVNTLAVDMMVTNTSIVDIMVMNPLIGNTLGTNLDFRNRTY